MLIELTSKERQDLIAALGYAIQWEDSFRDAHMHKDWRDGKYKPRRGSAKVVRKSEMNIKSYFSLRAKIEKGTT